MKLLTKSQPYFERRCTGYLYKSYITQLTHQKHECHEHNNNNHSSILRVTDCLNLKPPPPCSLARSLP